MSRIMLNPLIVPRASSPSSPARKPGEELLELRRPKRQAMRKSYSPTGQRHAERLNIKKPGLHTSKHHN